MPELNDSQKRRLQVSFARLDELLSEAVRILGAAEGRTPFSKYVPDATAVQQKVIADYALRMRAAMRATLEAFRLRPPPPDISAVWAARTSIVAAQITAAELDPGHMRGYGALPEESARELNAMVSELTDLLERMESYLAQGAGRDLRARLRALEKTAVNAELARELERVITDHGLVHLRAMMEMIVERLETRRFEVGVFGRTNSGKSSLLNHLLGTSVLPVGVTPMTSIPIGIVYGAKPWGRVWFVDAAPEIFDLGRLSEFADEHYNPSNARHVTRITVELPAPALREGITFVDTPGIGSLEAGGAAETLAYLPRCDLGVVLVDAASSLNAEDVALVDALHRAGVVVMALIAKSDLLETEDRWRTLAYVRRELESRTGAELPVYCVSVKGPDAVLCDQWRDEALTPLLRDHEKLADLSLRRKLGALRAATVMALERCVSSQRESTATRGATQVEEPGRVLARALAELDAAARPQPADPALSGAAAEAILDEASHNAAAMFQRSHDATSDVSPLLAASIRSRAGIAAAATARDLVKIRASLSGALASASASARANPIDDDDLPRAAGMPGMDNPFPDAPIVLRKPALRILGPWWLRRNARLQLDHLEMRRRIQDMMIQYQRRLNEWRSRALGELRRSFSAKCELIRGQTDGDGNQDAIRLAAMQEDLERLKRFDEFAAIELGQTQHAQHT